MRYSISNAIPHNPKSEKHPYENLVKSRFFAHNDVTKAVTKHHDFVTPRKVGTYNDKQQKS